MSRIRHRTVLKLCSIFLCASLSFGLILFMCPLQSSFAQTKKSREGRPERKILGGTASGTWKIEASRISYDQKTHTYEANGDVRISSEDRIIQADWALLDNRDRQADLRGHVSIHYGNNWLQGEHIVWNLDTETGWVERGTAYLSENQFYVSGAQITKTGPSQYELKEGDLTSCDPVHPDWKIKYKDLKVEINGMGRATHTSFWVRDLPLLYSPYIQLPMTRGRQSGFLLPWGGHSKLNGFDLEIPYYWAIRDDMDATFYSRYMTERGWMGGVEYLVANPTRGNGVWLFNYLHDQADKQFLLERGYPFQTEDRFWLRSRHSFELPGEIEGRLDLDVASDRNYLLEFSKGSTSFDYSDRLFRKFTGRGILNDETILARESSLYLDKRGESTLLGLDVRYWDELDKSVDEFALQRFPALSFSVIPSRVASTPFYYTLDSSMVSYWRNKGDQGGRLDAQPRLYYPLHWKSFLDVEPSVGLRATSYWVDWRKDSRDPWQGSFFPDMRMELSTRLNRAYSWSSGNIVALQHAIRPEVTYEYVSKTFQGDLPQFASLDENQPRHDVRYGISTFLTSKELVRDPQGNETPVYREMARLRVSQAYNIEEAPQLVPDLNFDPQFILPHEKGFADINMRLDLMPRNYLTLTYDTDISYTTGSPTQQDILMTLDSGKGQQFSMDYRSRKDSPVNEIITASSLKVMTDIYLKTAHDYSIERNELFSHRYGVTYHHGCWSLDLAYERDVKDQKVIFSINLLGLGTIEGTL